MFQSTPQIEELSYSARLDAIPSPTCTTKYVTGIAIFQNRTFQTDSQSKPSPPQLLIVKRASNEIAFPSNWEIPGGGVDPNETIRQCVLRETKEETSLDIDEIIGEFPSMSWISEHSGRRSVQFNYVATVSDMTILKLDEREHEEYRWITEREMYQERQDMLMTKEMEVVLKEAFKFANEKGM